MRWSRAGAGKRSSVRVVCYNQLAEGRFWLLLIYAKSARDNLPAHVRKPLLVEKRRRTLPLLLEKNRCRLKENR